MAFNKIGWQRYCRTRMRYKFQSYNSIAKVLKCSKGSVHRWLNNPDCDIPIDTVLHICRILEVSIGEYIIREELQLKLL